MPTLPVSLTEPRWAQIAALLPVHPDVDPTHPLGCHRQRIPARTVFKHVSVLPPPGDRRRDAAACAGQWSGPTAD